MLTSWPFVTDALTADTLINLALPKQHGTSGATMTMKNLMGIMGGRRGTIHGDFSQKIVDVNTLVKPTLAILDAYRVLFRNGPTGGSLDDVRLEKTLVAGTNQVSIDAYGTQFFGKTAGGLQVAGGGQRPGDGRDRPEQAEHRHGSGRVGAGAQAARVARAGPAALGPPLPLGLPDRLPAALPGPAHPDRVAARHPLLRQLPARRPAHRLQLGRATAWSGGSCCWRCRCC